MAPTRRKPDQLTSYIEEMIVSGTFPGGSRLPGLRELQKKFGISYGSALNSVNRLCDRGLLEKRARSGIYVCRTDHAENCPDDRELTISLFWTRPVVGAGLYVTTLCGIQESAAEFGTVHLHQCQLPGNCLDQEMFGRLSSESDGIILLCELDHCADALPRNKPCVGVMMHNSAWGHISTIDIDPFVAAEYAVRYLLGRKRKKACAVTLPVATCRNRAAIFAEAWKRATGSSCETIVCDVNFDLKNADHPGIADGFDPATGYFFASDNLHYDYWRNYRARTGRDFAADFAVISVDGKNLLHPDFPQTPTVAVDWRMVGARALEECVSRIRRPGRLPARIYLPGQLVLVPEKFQP